MKIRKTLLFILAGIAAAVCLYIIGAGILEMIQRSLGSTAGMGETYRTGRMVRGIPDYTAGAGESGKAAQSQAEETLAGMSLEEKAAQLFIITPDTLAGGETVTQADRNFEEAYRERPVGGFIMMSENIRSPEQISALNRDLLTLGREVSGIVPFLSVDEEGGTVTRIASNESFGLTDAGNMSDIGSRGDPQAAYEVCAYIGGYLKEYGFNLDFAPDADVWNNEENTVVRYRAFSSDAKEAAEMTAKAVEGFHSQEICTALKHFPGHGATSEDSHQGFAWSDRTLEELRECEYLPFQAGIDAGSEFVMVGHISVPEVTGDDTPASLSKEIVTDLLREELDYQGIVITDAMNMGAISEHYSSRESAVAAIEAGVDMILMPSDFYSALEGITEAVENGTIAEERLDQSVMRILQLKAEISGK